MITFDLKLDDYQPADAFSGAFFGFVFAVVLLVILELSGLGNVGWALVFAPLLGSITQIVFILIMVGRDGFE